MFRSATLKLTIWYVCIVMAISLIFSLVVYDIGTSVIARGIDRQSQRIVNQFPVFDNNSVLYPRNDINDSDHDLLVRLIILNIIVLLLAGLISYWLAKHTLEPIEEAHEQQKRFTSDVSHELRTPLTALKMESEVALISPKATAKELKQILKSNLEEANKLERLINNTLRLSRLETNEIKQDFEIVEARTVITNALKQVEAQAGRHQININAKIINNSFYGDADSITQLLVILLDNAIKYSGNATEVTLSSEVQGNSLVIKVIDHGIGIKKEALKHIFDRFYRQDGSRRKQGDEGFGLGLSIAKMIADIHGAVITVSSQLGQGTTVEVVLPQG